MLCRTVLSIEAPWKFLIQCFGSCSVVFQRLGFLSVKCFYVMNILQSHFLGRPADSNACLIRFK